jgi:hypothetical protein
VTSRAVTAGLGAGYVAVSGLAPLVLKTTPSDLDLYFWPSAETAVAGHPLLIYSAHLHALYPNANGPLGLVPLVPIAKLANALGWAGSLTGRAALVDAVVSLFVLLVAYQAARFVAGARGRAVHPLVIACVLLAPAVWLGMLDYGHVEQPVELCCVLLAITCFVSGRNTVTGIALGAAMLTRTIAGFCAIPLLLIPLFTRRFRATMTIALATVITIGVVMTPFLLADEQAVVHSLLTYRSSLPIGGGSFWIVARQAPWAGVIKGGDVYIGGAVALILVAFTLRRRPAVATTHVGVAGLLTVAACCFALFSKTVFPYYLLEPYVLSLLWWLARPGNAINWRGLVPLLLTIDVFIVKIASAIPFTAVGAVTSVLSSAVIAVAIGFVTIDLVRLPSPDVHASDRQRESHAQPAPALREAPR